MRNTLPLTRFHPVAMLAIAVAFTLQAAPSEQMLWKDLAAYVRGKQVTIKTKDGTSLSGRPFMVRPDGIYFDIGTPQKGARDEVQSLHWQSVNETQTDKLGKTLSRAYRHSGQLLGTQLGPIGLLELPAITAWGAAAVPFCLLGDLFTDHPKTSGDISILPDPALPNPK